MAEGIWLRFLSGPEIDSLCLSLLDVAIAHLILRKAEAADVGTMLRFH